MTGKYLTSVSPCGLNCTYALSFPGPAFKCTTQPGLKSNKDLNFTGCSVPCYQGKENIIEGPEYPKKTTNSMYGPTYDFFASYTVMGNVQNPLRTIKCTTWMADYKVNVTYTQGAQSVDVQLDKKYAINATMHDRYYDFYEEPLLDKATGLQLEVNRFARDTNGRYWEEGDPGIETLFREAQARAIKDSLVQPLLGTVIGICASLLLIITKTPANDGSTDSEAQKVTDTMILETIFAPSLKSVNVYGAVLTWELSLTPERLEELMINATLSVMTLGNWTTPADTIVTEWVGFYSFKNQKMIYIPYAVTLGVSLFYIILGLLALVDNGVAAEDVGFLQVACTTTGNVAFDEAAASGCLGGPSNTSGNSRLADMYLLYGDLGASQSYKGDGMVKRAGFGPPEQVRPLEKGGRYGCAMGSSESEPFLR